MFSRNEINIRNHPTLKNYVARYKMDKKLLEEHPEKKAVF